MTTEQKHTIEIQGLPEGWRAVAYRLGKAGEYFFCATYKEVMILEEDTELTLVLIVEKIKTRRIVLEETEEDTDPLLYQPIKIDGLCVLMVMHNKIWRVVEEE